MLLRYARSFEIGALTRSLKLTFGICNCERRLFPTHTFSNTRGLYLSSSVFSCLKSGDEMAFRAVSRSFVETFVFQNGWSAGIREGRLAECRVDR